MTRRDVKRPYTFPGSNGGPYGPSLMKQREPGPLCFSQQRFLKFPYQPALGTADGGLSEQHSQMGGQAQASRMSDSLPIEQNEVHICLQAGQNLLQRRTFPKGEKPRDVGKGHSKAQILLLKFYKLRISKEERPGPASTFAFRISHVRGSQKANSEMPIRKEDLTP